MLFNSWYFVLFFLPPVLLGWYLLRGSGNLLAGMVWLLVASMLFYGWWNPAYLFLLGGSITFNFLLGLGISRRSGTASGKGFWARIGAPKTPTSRLRRSAPRLRPPPTR